MVSGAAFMAYLQGVIENRQKYARDDLISILVNAEVDGARLADDELVAEAALLLIGGDETTRHVMTGGLYQLLTHPDQWQALREDRSLLPDAVEEMLRWVSPVKLVARTTTRPSSLRDKTIPTDTKVLLLYSSADPPGRGRVRGPLFLQHPPQPQQPHCLWIRHARVSRQSPCPPRTLDHVRAAPRPAT